MGLFPQSAPWAPSEGGPRFEKAMTPAPEPTLAQRMSLPLFPCHSASLLSLLDFLFSPLPSLLCTVRLCVLSRSSALVGPRLGVSAPWVGSPLWL